MNVLRIILTFVLILYLSIYQFKYWMFFLGALIPYYVITQILLADLKHNTPKRKAFICMWSSPSDPQIYGTQNLNINNLQTWLNDYSHKHGTQIGITIFFMKVFAELFAKFPNTNGNIIFGKFVPKNSVDISVMVATDGGKETDLITIKNCNHMSLEEISKKVNEEKQVIINKSDIANNRKLLIAKYLPTFILSPFVRIMSYLSICGLDLSWFGIPRYAYGTCIINNLGQLGIEGGFLPIPPYTYAPLMTTINKIKKKIQVDPNNDFKLTENSILKLQFTIDHRYLDGAQAAKIAAELEKYTINPDLLISK